MLEAALAAANQIFSPPFRAVLWKTLGLTLALLALTWAGLHKLVLAEAGLSAPWAAAALSILSGAGLIAGLVLLVNPVSFIVAGFYFDELAETVERDLDPEQPPGRALSFADAMWLSLKFSAVAIGVNLLTLVLLLVPVANAAVFFGANAYLYGRGYFELAAARYLPLPEVHRLRKINELRLTAAGLFIAALLAVPVLNFLTPLFSTAFMVRVTRDILRRNGKALRAG
jgi:CysZ protein